MRRESAGGGAGPMKGGAGGGIGGVSGWDSIGASVADAMAWKRVSSHDGDDGRGRSPPVRPRAAGILHHGRRYRARDRPSPPAYRALRDSGSQHSTEERVRSTSGCPVLQRLQGHGAVRAGRAWSAKAAGLLTLVVFAV